jgi:hypothetical protein
MASIKTTVRCCPRCSQPTTAMDAWPESVCGFCQWPLDDPGVECVRCGTLNPNEGDDCCSCARTL